MEKHKITKYYSSTKSKKGEEYRTRDNRKFTRVAIQTNLLPQGIWASTNAFNEDDPILKLKEGDEVMLKVWQSGDFWNFKIPSRLDLLEERVEELEQAVFVSDGEMIQPKAEIQPEDEDGVDIPF